MASAVQFVAGWLASAPDMPTFLAVATREPPRGEAIKRLEKLSAVTTTHLSAFSAVQPIDRSLGQSEGASSTAKRNVSGRLVRDGNKAFTIRRYLR